MNAPSLLEHVAALDLDKRFIEALLERAGDDTHPRVVAHLLTRLHENRRAWDAVVKPQPVERRRVPRP